MLRRLLVAVLVLTATSIATADQHIDWSVEAASIAAKGSKPSGGSRPASRPAPAPRPAPRPAPAPAPKPAPAPAPKPAPKPAPRPAPPAPAGGGARPSPPSKPRPAPAPRPTPKRVPAPAVPRPAFAPSPTPPRYYGPVVYVKPSAPRPVVVRPVTYVHRPHYVRPLYISRPIVVVSPVYWTANSCYQSYCHVQYTQCLHVFGDGCFCYPGLLQCVRTACATFYQPAVDQCLAQQGQPARCYLRCDADRYPIAFSSEPVATTPDVDANNSVSANATITFPDDVAFDDDVEYAVVVVLYIEAASAAGLQDADYEIATAIAAASSLPTTGYVDRSNVSLAFQDILVNDTIPVLEVTATIELPSLQAMQATDSLFQAMMVKDGNSSALATDLVTANVLFDPVQLSVTDVKSDVSFASNEEVPGNGGTTVAPVQLIVLVAAMAMLVVA